MAGVARALEGYLERLAERFDRLYVSVIAGASDADVASALEGFAQAVSSEAGTGGEGMLLAPLTWSSDGDVFTAEFAYVYANCGVGGAVAGKLQITVTQTGIEANYTVDKLVEA